MALIIMPMQAESLEVLERADLPSVQARAIVRAIEIEISGAKDTLATKHDLSELRTGLRAELSELRAALRGEMSALRAELRADMSELRGELRSEIHSSVSGVTRQMYAALLGQTAVLLGFAYFFATHVR